MRRRLFYPRMAFQNIVKNRRFFYPFIMTCGLLSAMFYDLFFLYADSGLKGIGAINSFMPILMLGLFIIALFALIILLYSNGFLMKNRKRELGLYNILGMQKRNIAHMMLWEMLYSSVFGIFGGLAAGIALSKLLLLTLFKLLSFDTPIGFSVSLKGMLVTMVLFGAIMLICLLYNVLCLRLSKPIELLRATSSGEREPKTKWVITVLGVLTLGGGYAMALTVNEMITAIALFFVAVLLVIIGTYCLFTSGSIAILKCLRRNKNYYYKPTHFTTVSGMLYRMKQNAAGLASICILSTMVLVVISTTVCLYTGVDEMLDSRFPSDMTFDMYLDDPSKDPEGAIDTIYEIAADYGFSPINMKDYSYVSMVAGLENDDIVFRSSYEQDSPVISFLVMTDDQYSDLSGENVELLPGEVIVRTENFNRTLEKITVAGHDYTVVRELEKMPYEIPSINNERMTLRLIVPDYSDLIEINLAQEAVYGEHNSDIRWELRFDLPYDIANVKDCFDEMSNRLGSMRRQDDTGYYTLMSSCRQYVEEEFMCVYGGLFFVGMFLGVLFLMATALIVYYKQITEGYDDKRRFEIMQQVGMSLSEVKKTVRGQILTVFFLPLLVACIHLAGAFNMIALLLKAFDLTNIGLFFTCCAVTAVVFAAGYAVIYALTARTYYKIVRA